MEKGNYEVGEVYIPLDELIEIAKEDIAALLWLNGNCEYCRYGKKEEYCGANRWTCARQSGSIDCKPKWRYANG